MRLRKYLVIYLLFFSNFLTGCVSYEYYSDAPRSFLSGKNEIKPEEDYRIDSIVFINKYVLDLTGYDSRFVDYNCDTCGKLVIKPISAVKNLSITKEIDNTPAHNFFSNDTVNVNNIEKIYFRKENIDYLNSALFVLGIIAGIVIIFFISFTHSFNTKFAK